jgi:hypothetical protein
MPIKPGCEHQSVACDFLLSVLLGRTCHLGAQGACAKSKSIWIECFTAKLHLAQNRERAQRDRKGETSASWIA